MRNTTDYDFPPMWGQMTAEQKHEWFVRERVFRQACRQDTAFGRRYRQHEREQERLDTSEFRVDEDLT
jgi:hypothetical protein